MNFFTENICVPDIMGINYYVTSERFLDEEVHNYPGHTRGGNELQEYVDVEAVRVRHDEPYGLAVFLREAYDRYKIPIAVTEAHLSCTREEQMRWFNETWQTCNILNEKEEL